MSPEPNIPKNWRVVASCRTPAFNALQFAIDQSLPRPKAEFTSDDHYDIAIERALGIQKESYILVEVNRIQLDDVKKYLIDNGLSKSIIDDLLGDERWQRLLSSPFSLRLARLALPKLMTSGPPTLDRLYETYIKAALYRSTKDIKDKNILEIMNDLSKFSNFVFQHKLQNSGTPLRAGIITQKNKSYDFSHHSLWEYFFLVTSILK